MPRKRSLFQYVSQDDFADAQERLHVLIRRNVRLPAKDDVPLEIASTEWSQAIEEMVSEIYETCLVKVDRSRRNGDAEPEARVG